MADFRLEVDSASTAVMENKEGGKVIWRLGCYKEKGGFAVTAQEGTALEGSFAYVLLGDAREGQRHLRRKFSGRMTAKSIAAAARAVAAELNLAGWVKDPIREEDILGGITA